MGKEILQEKKYFSITEVSELCEIKSHTLRFWEKEFKHLKPVTRKGNRRYYQKEDIRLIKKIRALLYEDGMTITGAKRSLQSSTQEGGQDTEMKTLLKDLEDLLIKIK
jgi:DNA-binding transcriptional MerR regulator|tara:strand:- start:2892 stop:3215 length:324 start_codon:yes stop_codon:yes gene_type:complete